MKIQMLYRKHDVTLAELEDDYTFMDAGLYIRAEQIWIDGDDLSDGFKHVKERDGERFINCVPA